MTSLIRLTAVASIGALAFAAAACTPAETEADNARDTDTTTIIEREVAADPVVIEREVPAPNPPVVIEDRRDGDSTTVRAGKDGIEVETTNR
ncbi:MAG: hypothetical protein U1E18_30225 [Brevundimonas sp.]|uniref:hypothetical protein n=1 Tax=Brevundimonas sp. TaxID=1871086 RepID=UPI002ABAC8AD|nr:hypothetical protein [Brevundimonas sp.]MDZ4113847.1 hypothetical protein [Brevundimonas sp.]